MSTQEVTDRTRQALVRKHPRICTCGCQARGGEAPFAPTLAVLPGRHLPMVICAHAVTAGPCDGWEAQVHPLHENAELFPGGHSPVVHCEAGFFLSCPKGSRLPRHMALLGLRTVWFCARWQLWFGTPDQRDSS